MTPFLWAALGMSVGAAVLHGALGIRRPIRRTYLSFAGMMAMLAVFFYLQSEIYRVTAAEAAVELTRRQYVAVHAFAGCMLVFIPAYTSVRAPRPVMVVYWAALAAAFVANIVAPYGVWYSGLPELVPVELLGRTYNSPVAQPPGILQIAHTAFLIGVLALAVWSAVKVIRRGERQRGLAMVFGVSLILVGTAVDYVRESTGGSWPYVSEFGVVSWALVMSVQLAHDFRVNAQALARAIADVEAQSERLTSMLGALHTLEANMLEPLHTLEIGVAALVDGNTRDVELQRLQRAVTRLREFSRAMPEISERSDMSQPGVTA